MLMRIFKLRSGRVIFGTASVAFAAIMIVVAAAPARSQSVNIVQMRQANVYGVVQFGPQVGPVSVMQTGQGNIAGVIQVGANPSARISQSGRRNSASIGQFENILTSGARLQMP